MAMLYLGTCTGNTQILLDLFSNKRKLLLYKQENKIMISCYSLGSPSPMKSQCVGVRLILRGDGTWIGETDFAHDAKCHGSPTILWAWSHAFCCILTISVWRGQDDYSKSFFPQACFENNSHYL